MNEIGGRSRPSLGKKNSVALSASPRGGLEGRRSKDIGRRTSVEVGPVVSAAFGGCLTVAEEGPGVVNVEGASAMQRQDIVGADPIRSRRRDPVR